MSESYWFECRKLGIRGARVYRSDARAAIAAKILLGNRSSDANDQLWVYRGGCEYYAVPDHLVGFAGYRPDGETIAWFPST